MANSQILAKRIGSGSPAEAAPCRARPVAGSIGVGLFSKEITRGRMGGRPAVSGSHGGVRRARIAKAAAQTRMVSVARNQLDPRKSCATFKGIFCHDISEIAVGTLITERPPHRTERAQFGHSAPTSGA